uniref:Nucleoporin NUP42 n=1 Tax=Oryzias latipes TaxID=8090 RepID=H2LV82_ORYLA
MRPQLSIKNVKPKDLKTYSTLLINSSAGEMAESKPVPQSQQVCRFFSQGRHCNFGKKCKFLHISDNTRASTKNVGEGPLDSRGVGEHEGSQLSSSSRASVSAGRRPCRYFLSGHCAMEERCRFWHPLQFPPEDVTLVPGNPTKAAPRCPPATYPSGPQEVKLCDVTEERANQLRDTEIKQLQKRFPKEQLIIQERSDGKVTYYRMTVEATDPDWPFDLKELDIMVRFPDNYPLEVNTTVFRIMSSMFCLHVQDASIEWLQAKHATNQLLGKVELLFRPFLRWLDRSLERLFTEGARELKKDVDLQKAGLQFIPYQELQQSCEKSGQGTDSAAAHCDEEVCNAGDGELITQEQSSQQEGQCFEDDQQQEEEASRLVENIKISDPRRGTEVKLLGLSLGENTATVAAQQITVSLQCNR